MSNDRRKDHTKRQNIVRYLMYNYFYFDKRYIHDLSSYFTRQYSCIEFLGNINDGIFSLDNKHKYDIIFLNTRPDKIAKNCTNPACCLRLSFRIAKSKYNLRSVVLVKYYPNIYP